MFLVDDILLAPLNGVMWLGEKLRDAAEVELYDESRLRMQLMELQERWMAGDVPDPAYEDEEARLLLLLDVARKRHQSPNS